MDRQELRRAIFTFSYLADSKSQLIPLDRLARSPVAAPAWEALQPKCVAHGTSVISLARDVGRNALDAQLDPHQRRTRSQIVTAAKKAESLATQLAQLILEHESLRVSSEDLYLPQEAAALDRLLGGILLSAISLSTNKFSPDVERRLDELQASGFPEFASMTTMDAYRLLRAPMAWDDWVFPVRLQKFAELARKSDQHRPPVPQPNRESAEAHIFAEQTCGLFSHCLKSPLIEIVTALTSAAFEAPNIDVDTVKKWWRRRDKKTR
jgi:hypothetical protein